MYRPLRVFFAFVILFFTQELTAQWFVGVKFMGFTFHPGKNTNTQYYDIAIGKKRKLVLNAGLAFTAEYMFYPNVSVKLDQAVFRDCAGKFAGMTMLNLRYTASLGKLGSGSAGIGPFLFYRKSWAEFDGYEDEGFFRITENKKWQTKFVWYGGELEHNYPVSKTIDISTNFLPGIPVVYALVPGIRYRLQ